MNSPLAQGFSIGDRVIKPREGTIAHAEGEVHVEPKVMDVLICLAEHGGEVVSRKQLIDTVWGHSFGADEALTRSISSLRQYLNEDRRNPQYIGTVPKRGYRLLAPVSALDDSPPQPGDSTETAVPEAAEPASPVARAPHGLRRWVPAALAVVALAAAIVLWSQRPAVDAPPKASVAVLPFVNMSPDEDAEYFSDGLTEELITALSKVNDLSVVARTSAFYFKGKSEDVRVIGKKLNVGAVLEGSVRRDGDNLRVTAQLVDVADGYHLWSERYDRKLEDVFKIQDDISRSVAGALKVALGAGKRTAPTGPPTRDLEAYELYLKGRHFLVGTAPEMQQGLEYLERAVAKAPDFALAYAAIAESYTLQAYLTAAERPAALPKARAAIARALEIDGDLAEAHAVAALISFFFDWDWDGAAKALKRAVELDPGHSDHHRRYSYVLYARGRLDEAIAEARKAQQRDPMSTSATHWLAITNWAAGNYEAAAREFRRSLEFHADWVWGHIKLGLVYATMGRADDALVEVAEAEKLVKELGTPEERAWITQVYARAGATDKARESLAKLEQLEASGQVDGMAYAEGFAALGDYEKALAWLEKAYQARSPGLVFMRNHPFFKAIHDDPRYKDLLRRMNLV
jgi:TolB-like protein/DNA-binding winged helix-turn-helix (wHTH) protein/Tfp pilus assembly protein PilF